VIEDSVRVLEALIQELSKNVSAVQDAFSDSLSRLLPDTDTAITPPPPPPLPHSLPQFSLGVRTYRSQQVKNSGTPKQAMPNGVYLGILLKLLQLKQKNANVQDQSLLLILTTA
jgi:hypothetical protein